MADNTTKTKPRLISMRLTEAQYGYLEQMVSRVQVITGTKVTRTSVILKLMEYGLPALERDFPRPHNQGEHDDLSVQKGA